MSVGGNIRRIREERGLTQTYVAEQAQVTAPAICQIERGTKRPSLQLSADIARILGCRMEDFLEGEEVLPAAGKGDLDNQQTHKIKENV